MIAMRSDTLRGAPTRTLLTLAFMLVDVLLPLSALHGQGTGALLAPPMPARPGTEVVTPAWLVEHYGEFALYRSEVHWLPDKQHLLLAVRNAADHVPHIEIVDTRTKARTVLGDGWEPQPSPDGRHVAFLRSREGSGTQLWVMRSDGSGARQLSHVPGGISTAEGINYAFAWAPNSRQVAFSTRPPFPRRRARVFTGDSATSSALEADAPTAKPSDSQLWLFATERGEPRLLLTEPGVVRDIRWFPGGRELLVASVHYGFEYGGEPTVARVLGVAARDGAVRTILELKGQHQLLNPDIGPDGRHIALTMDFDNGPLAGLVTSIGLAIRTDTGQSSVAQLTRDVKLLSGRWSPDGRRLYALRVYGAYRQLYAIDARSGALQQLTADPLTIESFALTADGRKIAAIGRDAHGRTVLREARVDQGGALEDWREIAELVSPPRGMRLSEAREAEWTTRDGLTMRGLLLYPLDYRAGTRYPLVVDIHGGGWGSQLRPTYGSLLLNTPLEWQMWTAKGYAVLLPDYRSTGAYGQQVLRDMFGRHDFQGPDLTDILGGVEYAIKAGVADSARLAVYGHSAGANHVNWLITQTDRFSAAVSYEGMAEVQLSSCIGSVIGCEWNMHWAMGGWPWEMEGAYRRNSATTFAGDARTPTLFLMGVPGRGGLDETGSVQFLYAALKRRGVSTQYVYYPDEGHVIQRPANRRDAFFRAVAWIDAHIRTAGGDAVPEFPVSPHW